MQLFEKLKEGLRATRSLLGEQFEGGGGISPELLEEALLAADVGVVVAEEIADEFERAGRRGQIPTAGEMDWLRDKVRQVLASSTTAPASAPTRVVLLVGVNGTGKTTTAAKLAAIAAKAGRSAVLVAADTFRAAAIDQLQEWGGRIGVPVIAQRPGADPAAVVFDALESARARGVAEVFIDTAGRLHTKHNLMAELEKVSRVCGRVVEGAPHEVLLVVDASTGSNGVAQAREFLSHAGVTGVVLTKLDGTAKGGVALAVARELQVPVRWVGVGERVEDLLPFDASAFAEALLEGVT